MIVLWERLCSEFNHRWDAYAEQICTAALGVRGVFRHSRGMKHISLLPTAEDTSVLWMTCC
jgi:hypothetical protein